MNKEKRIEKILPFWVTYNPHTGQFTFGSPPSHFFRDHITEAAWRAKYQGKPAGSLKRDGRVYLSIDRVKIFAHRAAWFLHYGHWPKQQIDHINGDSSDNRIVNLRDVSGSINRMNQRRRSDNTSGVTGVIYHSGHRKWTAQICVRGKRRQIGTFPSKEAAIAARLSEQQRLGFGPNHGASA
ncbi:HNH endonuclease [Qipengyuania atrilutea]|uniref:HNH endonuclease n=1 Tax=Qipengyuania atrilutea TaxID=2744473 RepID=A0A850H0Z4_9SPHN|nr:HNH endonuclease [Actirhodobacter atriluteus]NVD44366.1 HNH endonuclease [Actirhodobacter atriluteus]